MGSSCMARNTVSPALVLLHADQANLCINVCGWFVHINQASKDIGMVYLRTAHPSSLELIMQEHAIRAASIGCGE